MPKDEYGIVDWSQVEIPRINIKSFDDISFVNHNTQILFCYKVKIFKKYMAVNLKSEYTNYLNGNCATYPSALNSLSKVCSKSTNQQIKHLINLGQGTIYGLSSPKDVFELIKLIQTHVDNDTNLSEIYRGNKNKNPARPALNKYLAFLIDKLAKRGEISNNSNTLNGIIDKILNKIKDLTLDTLTKDLQNIGIDITESYSGNNENEDKGDYPAIEMDESEIIQTQEETWPRQIIFYGAPGTGKSHLVSNHIEHVDSNNKFRITFHPETDYSAFVGIYKPKMKGRDIVYQFNSHPFLNAYIRAWETNENVYLIIEELNRGNCAAIFGDIFQLLDRGKDHFSEYGINPDSDIEEYLKAEFNKEDSTFKYEVEYKNIDKVKNGEILILPPNLYIWATMNTSDQSLYPIDSAFTRRWHKIFIPINEKKAHSNLISNKSWIDVLTAINKIIEKHNPDKKIGPWFYKGTEDKSAFVGKVVYYLYNDVLKIYDPDNILIRNHPFEDFFNKDSEDIIDNINNEILEKWIEDLFNSDSLTSNNVTAYSQDTNSLNENDEVTISKDTDINRDIAINNGNE